MKQQAGLSGFKSSHAAFLIAPLRNNDDVRVGSCAAWTVANTRLRSEGQCVSATKKKETSRRGYRLARRSPTDRHLRCGSPALKPDAGDKNENRLRGSSRARTARLHLARTERGVAPRRSFRAIARGMAPDRRRLSPRSTSGVSLSLETIASLLSGPIESITPWAISVSTDIHASPYVTLFTYEMIMIRAPRETLRPAFSLSLSLPPR